MMSAAYKDTDTFRMTLLDALQMYGSNEELAIVLRRCASQYDALQKSRARVVELEAALKTIHREANVVYEIARE